MTRPASASIRTALAALALAAGGSQALAAPEANDLVAQLLIDRGVLSAQVFEHPAGAADSAAELGRRVRDSTSGLVVSAMNFLGVPYKRGGDDAESGFDCSGFTRYIYESSLGLLLPRRVDEQAQASSLTAVKRSDLQPGDLVFFNTLRRTFSHVGIYVGDGKFIHSPKSGAEVRMESISVRYWAKRFTGARRAVQVADATALTIALTPAPSASPAPTEPASVFPANSLTP